MKRKRGGGRGLGKEKKAQDVEAGEVAAKGKANESTKDETDSLKLAKKPGKLTRQDVTCPICWSILFEPTTLPCNHSLCMVCFKKHIEETSLCCPCCRLRISVWTRKVVKDDKLLDEELWARIQNEFPKLVEVRLNGGDSQDILEDELPVVPNSPSLLVENSFTVARDGQMCEGPGEIRAELELMMDQHQKDVEIERLREETASSNLIKQLEEEDNQRKTRQRHSEEQHFLLAKKIQEELEEEQLREKLASSNTTTPRRNLMKEWISSSSSSSNPSSTPKTVNKSSNNNSSARSKKTPSSSKKTPTSSSKKKTPTSAVEYTRASQDVMNKFLSSSQSQLTPFTATSSSVFNSSASSSSFLDASPCCSKSIPNHDITFSAFSPAKTSRNHAADDPSTSDVVEQPPPPAVVEESCWNVESKVVEDMSSKSPDSIKSEVDRHFRPIRSAPKTPPRRRADGTFLPEPKLVRTTRIRPSTSASSYSGSSPVKQTSDNADNGKPSSATVEKRISNDSGRGSDDTDDSRSPDGEPIISSPTGSDPIIVPSNFNTQSADGNERGCTSEDYRVTPETEDVLLIASDKQKRRLPVDEINSASSSPCKRAKIKESNLFCTPIKKSTSGGSSSDQSNIVKEEPPSPSILSDTFFRSPDSSPGSSVVAVENEKKYLEQRPKHWSCTKRKLSRKLLIESLPKCCKKVSIEVFPVHGEGTRRKDTHYEIG